MIVDDNAKARDLIREVLAEPGREFIEAADGGEAIALFAERSPDLVLMDIEMEPVDGFTATRAICSRDPGSRVVIVTDHCDERFRLAAKAAGACRFVNKCDLARLGEILADLIRQFPRNHAIENTPT